MKVAYTTKTTRPLPIVFRQDLEFRELEIEFPVEFKGKKDDQEITQYYYKLSFSHASPLQVWEVPLAKQQKISLVLSLGNPPSLWVKHRERSSHSEEARTWNKRQAWNRKTSLHMDLGTLSSTPISLSKVDSLVDVGTCTE